VPDLHASLDALMNHRSEPRPPSPGKLLLEAAQRALVDLHKQHTTGGERPILERMDDLRNAIKAVTGE